MSCRRLCRPCLSSISFASTLGKIQSWQIAAFAAVLFATVACFAQNQSPGNRESDEQSSSTQPDSRGPTITIPAGTRLALVLTQPVQTRHLRRGDDVYAQITSPVSSGDEVVIPPGTFVDGTVDRLERQGGRGEVRLDRMSITFPDGYVAPVMGPVILESSDGYAFKDPGPGRGVAAFAVPAAGAGIGALIGHSIGKPESTITSTLPPGCISAPPFCTTVTTPVFGTQGRDAIIGAGIGGAIGALVSVTLLFGSHQFFLAAGSPVELILQNPITLRQDEVAKAVRDFQQHPETVQPVVPPPIFYPAPGSDNSPPPLPQSSPPPLVIPGPPGPDGVPGAPIVIPQTP
ncbi:MAG TPA: hypothetical protein VGM18_18865 [Candidatus Sulfotelmatobacter sp.]|jgi:hypothetical protein